MKEKFGTEKMTTDDAISKLKDLRVAVINDNPLGSLHGMYEALNMAIDALEREPSYKRSIHNLTEALMEKKEHDNG